MIKDLWVKYKQLDALWKKVVLAIPITIILLLLAGILLWNKLPFFNKDLVDEIKENTDRKVKESEEKVEDLEKVSANLDKEKEALKREMEIRNEEARDIDRRIDDANDFYELERIRKEICDRRNN